MKHAIRVALMFATQVFLLVPRTAFAIEAPEVGVDQFQAWWQKEVDDEFNSAEVLPFPPTEMTRKASHGVLDGLAQKDAYRTNLAQWLKQNHADTAEDLLARWKLKYHRAFMDSFEFFKDKGTVSLLWKLTTPIQIDRSACNTLSAEELDKLLIQNSQTLLAQNSDLLVSEVVQALDQEFKRQNNPRPGDRPVAAVMTTIAINSFRAMTADLPPDDAERVRKVYSFNPDAAKPSAAEVCQMTWASSNAVLGFTTENPSKQVSATLLRSSMTSARYGQIFGRLDALKRSSRPSFPDFTPGKATVYYPELIWKNRVKGKTDFNVSVDEKGQVVDTSLAATTLAPEHVTSVDGSEIASDQIVLRVVDAYLRSGSFIVKSIDGSPAPYRTTISLAWNAN